MSKRDACTACAIEVVHTIGCLPKVLIHVYSISKTNRMMGKVSIAKIVRVQGGVLKPVRLVIMQLFL